MTDYEAIQKRVPEIYEEMNERRDKAMQELRDRLRESLIEYLDAVISPELIEVIEREVSQCIKAISDRVNDIIRPEVEYRDVHNLNRLGVLNVHFVDRQTGVRLNNKQLRELF